MTLTSTMSRWPHSIRVWLLQEVGYCQGISQIVGVLLMFLSTEDTFYMPCTAGDQLGAWMELGAQGCSSSGAGEDPHPALLPTSKGHHLPRWLSGSCSHDHRPHPLQTTPVGPSASCLAAGLPPSYPHQSTARRSPGASISRSHGPPAWLPSPGDVPAHPHLPPRGLHSLPLRAGDPLLEPLQERVAWSDGPGPQPRAPTQLGVCDEEGSRPLPPYPAWIAVLLSGKSRSSPCSGGLWAHMGVRARER